MLKVENIEYASTETVIFQRLTVVLLDFFYFWSVYRFFTFSWN
jgi:alpha-1,3-glucosyltransferase